MKLSDHIIVSLMNFVKGGYDVIIPNFFYGKNECDLFRVNQSDYVFEYEVKISRSDFFADFKKKGWGDMKHNILSSGQGYYCPNRFFYVVPDGLIKVDEVPKYAGLIYHRGGLLFEVKKSAPLLHKKKVDGAFYRGLARTINSREFELRYRLKKTLNGELERQLAHYKREAEQWRQKHTEVSNQLFLLKYSRDGVNNDQHK
jgi:hypothetical protein